MTPSFPALLLPLSLLACAAPAAGQLRPDAVMLRYPDVSATEIAFRYAGDLWLVDKAGGLARRITASEASEAFPRFSPDGRTIAFHGGYDGGSDLYTLPRDGGVPVRVTHHPAQELLSDWTPDGKRLLYSSSEISGQARAPRILSVPAGGGQPEPLPVPYGSFASIDSSGAWLAYTTTTLDFATWKRYRGGWATDIWLYELATGSSRRVTDYDGKDSMPMWHGRQVVFLSDRGENHIANLWAYDVDSKKTEPLTTFDEFDVKFPSMGPDDVVFQNGSRLWRYEFARRRVVPVEVLIPGERPALRPQTLAVDGLMQGLSLGPTGKRLAIEARGEVFSVPVAPGVTLDLTRSSGVAERSPAWSPDGRWIAWFSDKTGEYELAVARADGSAFEGAGPERQRTLTRIGPGWKSDPVWSPDSKYIAFSQNDGGLYLVAFDPAAEPVVPERVATDPTGEPLRATWSPDSRWLAWSNRHPRTRLAAIHLYDLEARALHVVTSGRTHDVQPVFDRKGEWLFYRSARNFQPSYSEVDTTWIYAESERLVAVPLRAEVESPWAPEDEQEGATEAGETGAASGAEEGAEASEKGAEPAAADAGEAKGEAPAAAKAEVPAVAIEIEGFEARGLLLPVAHGRFEGLQGLESGVAYLRIPPPSAMGDEEDEDSVGPAGATLQLYDLKEKKKGKGEKTVLAGVSGLELSADGKKFLVRVGSDWGVIGAAADQKLEEKIALSGLVATVDPRAEWGQLLRDTWRLYRDYFYDPGMHGVDWDAVGKRYEKALADATSREDLHYLIGEMMAELNVGHAYNSAPPQGMIQPPPARSVGLLGCDWQLDGDGYRVARVLRGESSDLETRSPLEAPGVDARPGDLLVAVNGVPVDASKGVYAAFVDTADAPTWVTLRRAAGAETALHRSLVVPLASETELRYRDWVAAKRARVAERSGGRIGYVHVPDTGIRGQNELVRQFLGEMQADALLVDERWNSGGQIPDRFIEMLDRPVLNYWALRHGEDWVWPPVGHRGPKAMLINGWSGSGGDCFPYYFRQAGLGKLIGMRTWGGLVGLSGNPALIDGASPTVPRFAFYETDGTWGVEGYGVAPDIEVIDDPAQMAGGRDPQLEVAIDHLLKELETAVFPGRPRPAGPDRSGAGVPPVDH